MNDIIINPVKHSLMQACNIFRKEVVKKRFGHLPGLEFDNLAVLGLYIFADSVPLKYLNDSVIVRTLELLNMDATLTMQAMKAYDYNLSHAVQSLVRPGVSWEKDHFLRIDTPPALIEFEQIWHPEYQRYVEHILNHLIKIPLEVLGGQRGKNYVAPALSNRIKILQDAGYGDLVSGFDSVIRNSISHGTITFETDTIRYKDVTDEKEVWPNTFGNLFDNLVETCQSLTVAFAAFIAQHFDTIRKDGKIPLGFQYLIAYGSVGYPGLTVNSFTISEIFKSKSQINIYSTSTTRSRWVHILDVAAMAFNCNYMSGGSFDRACIYIDCGASIKSLAVVNMDYIKLMQMEGFSDTAFSKALEGSLFWHDSSKIRMKLWMLRNLMNIALKFQAHNFRENQRHRGVTRWDNVYTIKKIENKSAGRIRRIQCEVSLIEDLAITKNAVHRIFLSVVKKIRNRLFRRLSMDGDETGFPRPPVYIWVLLYAKDKPCRSLRIGGWADDNFVAQGEWLAWPRFVRRRVLVTSPDETYNNIFIQYNPNIKLPD